VDAAHRDVSHLSKPAQFDTAEKIIGSAGFDTHYIPGEYDVLDEDGGKGFIAQFQKREKAGASGGAARLAVHGAGYRRQFFSCLRQARDIPVFLQSASAYAGNYCREVTVWGKASGAIIAIVPLGCRWFGPGVDPVFYDGVAVMYPAASHAEAPS
jgi:hypothetical protein